MMPENMIHYKHNNLRVHYCTAGLDSLSLASSFNFINIYEKR